MLQRAPGLWEPAEREFDLISELQNFSGKVKIEIQPEGPIAHKMKGDRTLVEDERKHNAFQGPWVLGCWSSRGPRTPGKALLSHWEPQGDVMRFQVGGGARRGDHMTIAFVLL